jgi:hypothetical protein
MSRGYAEPAVFLFAMVRCLLLAQGEHGAQRREVCF